VTRAPEHRSSSARGCWQELLQLRYLRDETFDGDARTYSPDLC
jgi:hypothetical protein